MFSYFAKTKKFRISKCTKSVLSNQKQEKMSKIDKYKKITKY